MSDSSQEVAIRTLPDFQGMIDSALTEHPQARGISAAIIAPDFGLEWTGSAGKADTSGTPLLPETPLLIASMTKLYMSATVLRLVELGKLQLEQPIALLLPETTQTLLAGAGYDLQAITVGHLLANTSGIYDYVNTDAYLSRTVAEPGYKWTREEQIALAVSDAPADWVPAEHFNHYHHSETNFLLLTQVFEQITPLPFHLCMRNAIDYVKHDLPHTWFVLQEKAPKKLPALPLQTAVDLQVNSHTLNITFDAFGGGGLAATAEDAARFSQALFSGKLFDRPETASLLLQQLPTLDPTPPPYRMGVMEFEVLGMPAFGHGGFWGTMVRYIPSLNTTIAVFVLERSQWPVTAEVIEKIARRIERDAQSTAKAATTGS